MELAERVRRGRKAIALARSQGRDTTEWERRLKELFEEAGQEPATGEGVEPWMLWEWRRVSIPEWRRILKVSLDSGDSRREGYARWMLREILLDPDYVEEAND
ncbi:MAG: hypothetical protein ACE5Q6_25935 [Dehalococcoidia bacterium]